MSSANPNITFGKITAMPLSTSWSQVYNAGTLFAVLSLATREKEDISETPLNLIGKETINTLEEEYYTLEAKNLDSIKKAILATAEKLPKDLKISLAVASIIKNVLYIFVLGEGKVLLKRNDKVGTLLHATAETAENLTIESASGFLEDNDLVILETKQFSTAISKDTLISALGSAIPTDIADLLAPKIHEQEDGGSAAIIIHYKDPDVAEPVVEVANGELPTEEPVEEITNIEQPQGNSQEIPHPVSARKNPFSALTAKGLQVFARVPILTTFLGKTKRVRMPQGKLTHSKRMFLTIAIIIMAVLVSSVFLSLKKREDAKVQAMLQEVTTEAQKKYDEGQALIGLNKNLARDNFVQAEKILTDGKAKFKEGSQQEKQITDLLVKVQASIAESSGLNNTNATETDAQNSPLLALRLKNSNIEYATKDENVVFAVAPTEITKTDLKTDSTKSIIQNKSDWSDLGGIGTYLGNLYILDTKESTVIKYVPSGSTYTKGTYFASGVSPELSTAVSLAIDGSIWILKSDGEISRFTRGKPDPITVSSLDKPFSKPTRIATTPDDTYVYVLDAGNSRVVLLDKKGAYQAQYAANILKNADDFDVVEREKKMYVLSNGKVFTLELK